MIQTLKQMVAVAALLSVTMTPASAALIAQWTFETSVPTTAGPFNPEVGSGAALGVHSNASTVYSNPVGNGSVESFSSDKWSVGDYYQFNVSTVGYSGIQLSWDQTGSSTGPKDFKLAYSTNGSTFSDFTNYAVQVNGAPNTAWSSGGAPNPLYSFAYNLGSLTTLDNAANVYFRLVNTSAVALNGGSVATTGTGRVDNVTVSGTAVTSAVPLPAAVWLLGAGVGALGWTGRRRSRA